MRVTPAARTTNVVVLVAFMLFTLVPLFGVVSAALQPADSTPRGFTFPWPPHWENFATAWNVANVLPLMLSSAIIVVGVVPASLLFATFAGYGLAQPRVPFGRALTILFVGGLTLPAEALVSPLYYQMRDLGLLDTRLAIILPLIGLYMPFGVFWMQTHFSSIPVELIEAARIDGASSWRIFWSVQVPLARSAISALMILFFLWTWNQFLLSIALINDPLQRTVAGALGAFQGEHSTNIVLLCAGSLLIIAPSLVVYLVFQRQFIGALLQGSHR